MLFGSAGPLQDDRDEPASVLPPGLEAFETVDDLKAPVRDGDDTDGQQRDVLGRLRDGTWSERGVAGTQRFDGQEAEVSCGLLRR